MRKKLEAANIAEAKAAEAEAKKDLERVELDIDDMTEESKEIMRSVLRHTIKHKIPIQMIFEDVLLNHNKRSKDGRL